jgi:hypothetical protein
MLGLSEGFPAAFRAFCHFLFMARVARIMAGIKKHNRHISTGNAIFDGTRINLPSEEPTVETPRDSSSALLTGALNNLAIMLTHRLEMS